MNFVRKLAKLSLVVIAAFAAAVGGYLWIERPLWIGEYTGSANTFGFTADGSALLSIRRRPADPNGDTGYRIVRHVARTGRVVDTAFIKVDPSELPNCTARLLCNEKAMLELIHSDGRRARTSLFHAQTGNLADGSITPNWIAIDDAASMSPQIADLVRSAPMRENEPGLITPVSAPPEFVVATRNSRLQPWQEAVNPWLGRFRLPKFKPRSEFTVVVLDAETAWKIGEMPQLGTHFVLSTGGRLLGAYDTEGRIVVWDVRRNPMAWGFGCGIAVLAVFLGITIWLKRRRRDERRT